MNEVPVYAAVRKGDTETLELVNAALARMSIEEPDGARICSRSITTAGKLTGIMIDLFEPIAERAGIAYEWLLPATMEEYARMPDDGKADICIDLTPDFYQAEIKNYTITDTYLTAPFSWLCLNNHQGDGAITKAAKLYLTALTPSQYAYNNVYHNLDYIKYSTVDECIQCVLNGATDGFRFYTYYLEQLVLDDPGNKPLPTIAQTENQFAIGVHSSLDRNLVTILNTTIDTIADRERIGIPASTARCASFYPADGDTLETLYEKADQAMYQAKRSGKNRMVFTKENQRKRDCCTRFCNSPVSCFSISVWAGSAPH